MEWPQARVWVHSLWEYKNKVQNWSFCWLCLALSYLVRNKTKNKNPSFCFFNFVRSFRDKKDVKICLANLDAWPFPTWHLLTFTCCKQASSFSSVHVIVVRAFFTWRLLSVSMIEVDECLKDVKFYCLSWRKLCSEVFRNRFELWVEIWKVLSTVLVLSEERCPKVFCGNTLFIDFFWIC